MSATTEARHESGEGLDSLAPAEVLSTLYNHQLLAAEAVRSALPAVERAAQLAARCVMGGGRLIYAGAGSSGLMALADGLELPGTFGLGEGEIALLIAGGRDSLQNLAGTFEDRVDMACDDVAALAIGKGDCVLCIAASGSTPYTLAVANAARQAGASIIGIANNGGTPLLSVSDVAVLLETPPEVVAGSTRMGAGTAQKIALNLFSTAMAVRLGHVHDGYMVNLVADNSKLRERAEGIVMAISGASPEAAKHCLERAAGSVKLAVLMAAGVRDRAGASSLLEGCGNNLRRALAKAKDQDANECRQGIPQPGE